MKGIVRKCILVVAMVATATIALPVSEASKRTDRVDILEQQDEALLLYSTLGLKDVVTLDAFRTALTGYHKIEDKGRKLLTLIDFSKPSREKRLVVIDMLEGTVLMKSLVSHGRNSGEMYATRFSNRSGSYMSSLGFYLTGGTYQGGNGYSLRLYGLEKGVNDKAYERAIVMHGADYCNPQVVAKGARLGRSLGCPAVPQEVAHRMIDLIKGGSVLFIYAEDDWYQNHSPILAKL